MHSRDEQRSRAPGEAPSWREEAGLRVLGPRDPVGGGTWLLARADGFAVAMMNVNPVPAPPPPDDRVSRGTIPLRLIDAEGLTEARERVERIAVARFQPFRVLVVELDEKFGFRAGSWRWDGQDLSEEPCPPGSAVCFGTSGLGDGVVADRVPLFERMVGSVHGTGGAETAQNAYHRHQWADRLEASVLMTRADARTVSITTLEAVPGLVRMHEEAVPE